eukprot:GHVL01044768.1.p1 GENE.GHVL01044768.1~~GHVL01044768.1.p1  ORF type:complete len:709 (+),score=84.04 GHVL01044768.1:765-2891(+)
MSALFRKNRTPTSDVPRRVFNTSTIFSRISSSSATSRHLFNSCCLQSHNISMYLKDDMSSDMPYQKYENVIVVPTDTKWSNKQRKWPDSVLRKAPRWCSVDLRCGNESLITPMNIHKKLLFFKHLMKVGFREIDIGSPGKNKGDYELCKHIIGLAPSRVRLSVLAGLDNEQTIHNTISAVHGATTVMFQAIVPTSPTLRQLVNKMRRTETLVELRKRATRFNQLIQENMDPAVDKIFEFTADSFSQSELEFSLDIVRILHSCMEPTVESPLVFNMGIGVEICSPSKLGDMIEWINEHLKSEGLRETTILSLNGSNDRGTAVAAAEIGLQAGLDRIEGSLFGNADRCGNVCIPTLAINLFASGVDPELNFSDIQETVDVYQYSTEMKVPQRYPWAGELSYTSAGPRTVVVKQALQQRVEQAVVDSQSGSVFVPRWSIPYLQLDPKDLGFSYKAIFKKNPSDGGREGVAVIMEREFGYQLPKLLQVEFAKQMQIHSGSFKKEIAFWEIYEVFKQEYISTDEPFELMSYKVLCESDTVQSIDPQQNKRQKIVCIIADVAVRLPSEPFRRWESFVRGNFGAQCEGIAKTNTATLQNPCHPKTQRYPARVIEFAGKGNGPVDAFLQALSSHLVLAPLSLSNTDAMILPEGFTPSPNGLNISSFELTQVSHSHEEASPICCSITSTLYAKALMQKPFLSYNCQESLAKCQMLGQ